ncbi:MAG: phosphate ABC transporter, permease protein PstA, partial [Bacteroidia bacterium]|nr:phosphate ABC transporter, permease protein PstA [Bacteroidia bacterium]
MKTAEAISSKKYLKQAVAFNAFRVLSFSVVAVLALILSFIVVRGISV